MEVKLLTTTKEKLIMSLCPTYKETRPSEMEVYHRDTRNITISLEHSNLNVGSGRSGQDIPDHLDF